MDSRLVDIIIGVTGFFILVAMLLVFPAIISLTALPPGSAYVAAILVFIIFMSGAGAVADRYVTAA